MKKEIKKLEQIYGSYLTEDFVTGLYHIAKEAQIRARHNLSDLTYKDSTNTNIHVCVDAEKFWKLIEYECRRWLNENQTI